MEPQQVGEGADFSTCFLRGSSWSKNGLDSSQRHWPNVHRHSLESLFILPHVHKSFFQPQPGIAATLYR
jgi:hypothetical protein